MYTSKQTEIKIIISLTVKDIIQMKNGTCIRLTKHDINYINEATDVQIKIVK